MFCNAPLPFARRVFFRMKESIVIFSILVLGKYASAFSPRLCTPDDLKIKKAGFEVFTNHSYLDQAGMTAAMVGVVPLVVPIIITFLGRWNLVHAPTDSEIEPLIMFDKKDAALGINLKLRL